MVINAKKFTKLRKKLEKKLVGSYGSGKGLGQDLIIKKYSYLKNNYGDRISQEFVSQETCKGIVISSNDSESGIVDELKVREGEVRLYIPVEFNVLDTDDYHYEFEFGSQTYNLIYKNDIGQVCNITGVVREITLKIKP